MPHETNVSQSGSYTFPSASGQPLPGCEATRGVEPSSGRFGDRHMPQDSPILLAWYTLGIADVEDT